LNYFIATVLLVLVGRALAILAAMYFVKPKHPCHTGFRIVMPDHLRIQLTDAEYMAVYAHECGHRYHRHQWKNYFRTIFFNRPSRMLLQQQELEADEWASHIVWPTDLARALMKLGAADDFDLYRVNLLRKAGGMPATQTCGMHESHNGEAA
jgi:Zn-dependent protease with chaperone function